MVWTVGKRLMAGFGLLFSVTMVLGVESCARSAADARRVHRLASVAGKSMEMAGTVRFLVADLLANARQLVIATAKADAGGVAQATEGLRGRLRDLDRTTTALADLASDEQTRRRCEEIAQQVARWAREAEKIERFAANGQALEAADAGDAAMQYGAVAQRLAQEIVEQQARRLETERAEVERSVRTSRIVLFGILVAALCAGGFVFWSVSVVKGALGGFGLRLREGATQVVSAAGQVATSAQGLAQGTTEQTASLEQTSAAMEEMSSMTRRNADSAREAAALMAEIAAQVEAANGKLGSMVASMGSIRESSTKVSRIIKTIDEIAFQTNILALNAAVEAARAGEAGMGFAVVADEVRSLAQRAAQAAHDTAALIEEAGKNATDGAARVDQVAVAIHEVTAGVKKVKAIADDVSSASAQQSEGIGQVMQAIAEMEKLTQASAATAEESAAASEELNAQAEASMDVVGQLEAMLGGAHSADGARRTPRRSRAASSSAQVMTLHQSRKLHAEDESGSAGTYGSF